MSKNVVKVTLSALQGIRNNQFQAHVDVYTVDSIGKKVNVTLQSVTGDIKKRFDLEGFGEIGVRTDLRECRASVKFLVNDVAEVNVDHVIMELKEAIIENMTAQLRSFESYIKDLERQETFDVKSFNPSLQREA